MRGDSGPDSLSPSAALCHETPGDRPLLMATAAECMMVTRYIVNREAESRNVPAIKAVL